MLIKSTSKMKWLTMFLESDLYFHKFTISCKVYAYCNVKSIGGFGLNFSNLTPLIRNPGAATESKLIMFSLSLYNLRPRIHGFQLPTKAEFISHLLYKDILTI